MRRSTFVLLMAFLLCAHQALAADLKITDSRGTEVIVSGAAIDYGGFLAADRETLGIRVSQGDGTVTLKWTDVASIKVTGEDTAAKPPRLNLEIVLKSGKKVPAALLRQGRMKLVGKSELGEYSIDLDKVRTIVPIR